MNSENVVLISKIQSFLQEFDFSGISSARFYNTLFLASNKKDYIINYFKLIDNPNTEALMEKMMSKEFKNLMKEMSKVKPTVKPINQRLSIYYGNQGTGKTTQAIRENPDAKVFNCNSSYEPNDLLETFDFESGLEELKRLGYDAEMELANALYDQPLELQILKVITNAGGKPKYKATPLLEGMIEGKKVILDEINLLNRDCLRSLQAFLDNKKEFTYKGKTIKIKEGFEIIGTMNLEVNGQIESLPSPLVDRAKIIKYFTPNCELLAEISIG